jgi:nitrite reductase/ring-hydroxylating ferredoxin subunit
MAEIEHDPRAERFDRYLEALLAGERPSPDDVTDRDEAEMARLAAELSAAVDPDLGDPDAAFLEQLRLRMRQADSGIAAVQEPLPLRPGIGDARSRIRVSRRQLLQAGIVGVAGLAAGAVGATTILRKPEEADLIWDDGSGLVTGEGRWFGVANLDDLPIGAALRFTTPAFEGYLVNDSGTVRALIAVCTHMGCSLHFRESWNDLRCPCHGASFDMNGHLANGRAKWRENGPYVGDDHPYPTNLPDLVRPQIKIEDRTIMVLSAEVQPPNTAGPVA